MLEPRAASCMSWYVARALLVSPLRVHTSISVVAILQSGWHPSDTASSQTCMRSSLSETEQVTRSTILGNCMVLHVKLFLLG